MNNLKAAKRPQKEKVPSVREARNLFSSRRAALSRNAGIFRGEFSDKLSALSASSTIIGRRLTAHGTKIPLRGELGRSSECPSFLSNGELGTLLGSSAELRERIESANAISPLEKAEFLSEIAEFAGYGQMFIEESKRKEAETSSECEYLDSLPKEATSPRFIQNPREAPFWPLLPAGLMMAFGQLFYNLPKSDSITVGLIGAGIGAFALLCESAYLFCSGKVRLMKELEQVLFRSALFEAMKQDALSFLEKIEGLQGNLNAALDMLRGSQTNQQV
ncbi:hypothetical protein JW721_03690 [Candidatus Micrarchaeota archaeon]|nr:hypothetical protein [Candidatus Micrarchaeota archaeon]